MCKWSGSKHSALLSREGETAILRFVPHCFSECLQKDEAIATHYSNQRSMLPLSVFLPPCSTLSTLTLLVPEATFQILSLSSSSCLRLCFQVNPNGSHSPLIHFPCPSHWCDVFSCIVLLTTTSQPSLLFLAKAPSWLSQHCL